MKKRIFGWLALLCPFVAVFSQSKAVHPLTIGDVVPDLPIGNIVHYSSPTARLSDFKDKLLILDILHTQCKSCLHHLLYHLDTLQTAYKDRIQVIPVTNESRSIVTTFLEKNTYGKKIHFPFIAADSVIHRSFPHQFVSHVVWLYKGRVKAITSPDYVTPKNIDIILAGKPLSLPVKADVGRYNPAYPLLVPNAETLLPTNQSALRYYSTLVPYLNGFSYGRYIRTDSTRQVHQETLINHPIVALYQYATGAGKSITEAFIKIETKDSSRFFFDGKGYKTEWWQNTYSGYQATTPLSMGDTSRKMKMLADLDFYLGLHGRLEKRITHCLVLRPDTSVHVLPPRPPGNIAEIFGIAILHNRSERAIPMFVEMGGDDQRYVPLPADLNDIPAMARLLQPYGIRIEAEEREVELLVITDSSGYQP